MTDTRERDAWGLTVTSTGSTATPFGFVGGQDYRTDPDSGLLLLGARYYDPSVGRFLSRDPLRYGGGDVNLHRCCNNNPVNATDPSGCFVVEGAAAGAAAEAAVAVGAVGVGATVGPVVIGVVIVAGNVAIGVMAANGGGSAGGSLADASQADGGATQAVMNERLAETARDDGSQPYGSEVYYHYTQTPPEQMPGGLWAGASGAVNGDLFQDEASQGLGIPPPTWVYPVTVSPGLATPPREVDESSRYWGANWRYSSPAVRPMDLSERADPSPVATDLCDGLLSALPRYYRRMDRTPIGLARRCRSTADVGGGATT